MAILLRFCWLIASGWLLSPSLARAQSSPALTLTIVPSSYSRADSAKPAIWFSHRGHFHVLLTNLSAHPVTLFQEWNSWGYYGLYFEITYPDGRKVAITRSSRGWDQNFPSTFTLAPQGYYVFEVSFDHTWTPSPRAEPTSGHGLNCRLQASYSIEWKKDDTAFFELEPGAPLPWAGTVHSKEEAYLLWP